jgi:hypothetical protein
MPSSREIRILFVGDVIGRPGRRALAGLLPGLKHDYDIDLTVANGENAAGGFGLTPKLTKEFLDEGVDVITSGNHIWDRREMVPSLDSFPNVLRPLNYPAGVPGRGWGKYCTRDGIKICVVNLQGRVFMKAIDCPFKTADRVLEDIGETVTLVDMHAEATSEKVAMGWHLDGRVSAVIGTHTHVQTADDRILPGGTAYLTDAGMTGAHDSVIGIEKKAIIERFLTGIPNRFDSARYDVRLSGVVVSVDPETRRATSVERIHRPIDLEAGDGR